MKTCHRCSRTMEEGFTIDSGDYDSPRIAAWHPGTPDRRWWGLKVAKAKKRPLVSWRCTGCGLLETYAP